MTVEVYNATQPALPRRALISSAVLLGLSCLLAARLTASRAREPLAVAIEPEGWRISFRPPKRFAPGEVVATPVGQLLPLYGHTSGGAEARLGVFRLHPETVADPDALSADIALSFAFHRLPDGVHSLPIPAGGPLGPFRGTEALIESLSSVARVAVPPAAVGYAVALAVDGEPISDELYQAFDSTCRSLKPVVH